MWCAKMEKKNQKKIRRPRTTVAAFLLYLTRLSIPVVGRPAQQDFLKKYLQKYLPFGTAASLV